MNRTMSVSQLSAYLKGVFDDEELLHDVTLTGEVTDVSYSDKHTFLVLAEGNYSVRCVHFSSRDRIEKGSRVALKGSVSFYAGKSTVSFNYSEFFLGGVGDKNARYERAKKELAEKGMFENRKQLPKYVTDVVVVTSPDGAAIRDFMRVVYDKCPFVNIRVCPVRVQGDGAADMIRSALNKLQSVKTDAIILCRGGGSEDDLDCFNDEQLAIAVAQSKIPVISAVGHEINYSLCDYCAGTRAGTPSIAGEIVNAHAARIKNDLISAMLSVKAAVARKYMSAVNGISRSGAAAINASSARIFSACGKLRRATDRCAYALIKRGDAKYAQLSASVQRLKSSVSFKFGEAKQNAELCRAKLDALDPHRIIKIGYAAVLGKRKRITAAKELEKGESVALVFADGKALCDVTDVIVEKGDVNG